MIPKTELRKQFLIIRNSIPEKRRKLAAQELALHLKRQIQGPTLSFSSFGSEIDTSILNHWLIEQGFLYLPRVEKGGLGLYFVQNIQLDLVRSPFGILEPDPDRCPKIDFKNIKTTLIAGLAFDESLYRLGYGKGHYDKLIPNLSCSTIGLAFIEQKTDLLPRDPWDVPMDQVLYF